MKEETYKNNLKSYDEFYKTWKEEELFVLSPTKKQIVYNEYYVKWMVLNRDSFHCQVTNCTFTNSPITLHHFKHKSNGGRTTLRNSITVCRAHQTLYHTGRGKLVFNNLEVLPKHIRGRTQVHDSYFNKLETEQHKLPKDDLLKYKSVRKENKQHHNIKLNWITILQLFVWLNR